MSFDQMETEAEFTEDGILGGRLRVRQPLRGHRVGHDAIILAAATGGRASKSSILARASGLQVSRLRLVFRD